MNTLFPVVFCDLKDYGVIGLTSAQCIKSSTFSGMFVTSDSSFYRRIPSIVNLIFTQKIHKNGCNATCGYFCKHICSPCIFKSYIFLLITNIYTELCIIVCFEFLHNFAHLKILYCSLFSPQNLIAQAQSGTGKTAAFVLTMLSRVNPENKWPQCLCLAPTFELATQIGQVVMMMSQYMPGIRIRFAVKGQRSEFLGQVDAIICTTASVRHNSRQVS